MIRRATSTQRILLQRRVDSQSQHSILVTESEVSTQTAGRIHHNWPLCERLTTCYHRTQKIRSLSPLRCYSSGRQTPMLEFRAPYEQTSPVSAPGNLANPAEPFERQRSSLNIRKGMCYGKKWLRFCEFHQPPTTSHLCPNRYPTIIFTSRWSVPCVIPTPMPALNSHFGDRFRSMQGINCCCWSRSGSKPVTGPSEP